MGPVSPFSLPTPLQPASLHGEGACRESSTAIREQHQKKAATHIPWACVVLAQNNPLAGMQWLHVQARRMSGLAYIMPSQAASEGRCSSPSGEGSVYVTNVLQVRPVPS